VIGHVAHVGGVGAAGVRVVASVLEARADDQPVGAAWLTPRGLRVLSGSGGWSSGPLRGSSAASSSLVAAATSWELSASGWRSASLLSLPPCLSTSQAQWDSVPQAWSDSSCDPSGETAQLVSEVARLRVAVILGLGLILLVSTAALVGTRRT
jgi:hypothetical protein